MNKPDTSPYDHIRPVLWEDNRLKLIDQRKLPNAYGHIYLDDVKDVAQAISDMVVRGAPAIGITAAYGVVIAARARYADSPDNWRSAIQVDLDLLRGARPTAVNLAWAVNKMTLVISTFTDDMDPVPTLLSVARGIHMDDIAANQAMGELGAGLIEKGSAVLTHCNAGALATGGYGTALGVIRAGYAQGKITKVYADETRPWLQGPRLTAWELLQDKIPVMLIVDGAAAYLMAQDKIQWVIVGSDRIAANGDVANKIGTYSTAVNARFHGVKFMVVAPASTVDLDAPTGADIPVEARNPDEVLVWHGQRMAPEAAGAWNPVFDITPAELVDVIITEHGIIKQPTCEKMATMMAKNR